MLLTNLDNIALHLNGHTIYNIYILHTLLYISITYITHTLPYIIITYTTHTLPYIIITYTNALSYVYQIGYSHAT